MRIYHEINNEGESLEEAFILAEKTWKESDGPMMMDYSSQQTGARKGAHTEHIDLIHFRQVLQSFPDKAFDIMLEIKDKEKSARLAGKKYKHILLPEYQWSVWACPKGADGKLDHHKTLDGDDLRDFVNNKLFPYLKKFRVDDPNTIEYKIGEIFHELKNKIQSGYSLRNILDTVDKLHFQTDEEKHELSHLYESKIQNMGNAGRDGGQYYTPRPLIRTIVKVVNPKLGETIYDGACGSAGFLVEAFNYLTANREKLSSKEWDILQTKTFYGKEKFPLPYIIGVMNMILHGIEVPNIKHTNTLAENLSDIQEKDRYNIILANPPFGGKERKYVSKEIFLMLFLSNYRSFRCGL